MPQDFSYFTMADQHSYCRTQIFSFFSLKTSLPRLWTSQFWHSNTMRSVVSPVSPINPLHHPLPPSPPTALHPQSSLTSVSWNPVPHSNPGVCKTGGQKGKQSWNISSWSVYEEELDRRGGGCTVGIRPQNTPPHVVSIRNNLVFLPTTERKGGFFCAVFFFSLCKPTRPRGGKIGNSFSYLCMSKWSPSFLGLSFKTKCEGQTKKVCFVSKFTSTIF